MTRRFDRRTGRKITLWFRADMMADIQDEAKRLERTSSDLIRLAWRLARARIKKWPQTSGGGH